MKEELNKWLDACINDFADDVAEQFGGDTDRHPVPESVKNLPKATIKSKLDSQKAELIDKLRQQLRGEDINQYRPSDMVSMGYVEEILDDIKSNLEKGKE